MDQTFIPNLSAVGDFIGGNPQPRDGTGGIFFLRANSYTISYSLDARKNREQLRRDGGGGHEGARAGRSGENLGVCGRRKGPGTRGDQAVRAVTRGSRYAPSNRLKSAPHDVREREREQEGGHLHSHITRARTAATTSHHALPSQRRLPEPVATRAKVRQQTEGTEREAWLARASKIDDVRARGRRPRTPLCSCSAGTWRSENVRMDRCSELGQAVVRSSKTGGHAGRN